MNKLFEEEDNKAILGKFLFISFYISLFIGFYFNEDSSGSGGFIADFNNTWGYIIALQNKFFVFPSEWVLHTPLHFLIISKFYPLFESKYSLRLFYCSLCFLIPLIFYKTLRIKFSTVNKNLLLIFSCSIFLLPAFRSGAIWANDHITASFFFLVSLYYFVKWEKKKDIRLIYLQSFFLALAVYTRQYYATIFFYYFFVYYKNLNFKFFFFISSFVFLLSLPGFFLVYYDPILLSTTFDSNLSNTILVSSSILSFYLLPFYFFKILKDKEKIFFKREFYMMLIFSFIFIIILFNFYNYNYKTGGGFFIKLSYLIFNNAYFFLLTSISGMLILLSLIREDKSNTILVTIMLLGFPAYMIFQKYYEPMFLFILFFLIKTNLINNFFTSYKNVILYYCYILFYLLSAIINDYLDLTKTVL